MRENFKLRLSTKKTLNRCFPKLRLQLERILHMLKNKKTAVIAGALILVVVAAILIIVYWKNSAPVQDGTKDITVEIVFSEDNIKTVPITTDAEYLNEALLQAGLIEEADDNMGLYETIDGVKADWDGKQEWWCVTKDGEMLFTGINETPVADGDHYEFTLAIGY